MTFSRTTENSDGTSETISVTVDLDTNQLGDEFIIPAKLEHR